MQQLATSPAKFDAPALLKRGGVGVFGLRVGALLLGFAADLVLTNALGLEQYGLLAIGISWLSILIPVACLGINTALVKVLPAEQAQGNHGLAHGALRWSSRRMLLSACVVALLFALAVLALGERVAPPLRIVLLVLAMFLPVQVLSVQRQAVLQAFKHPVLSLLPEQIVRWLAFLGLVGALVLWRGDRIDAGQAAWVYGGGMLIGLCFASFWSHRRTPASLSASLPTFAAQHWWLLALPMGWNTVMRLLNSRADPAMLGWLMGPSGAESAAQYAVANRLASLLLFGMVAVNAVAAPLISELHAKGKREDLQRLVSLAAKGLTFYAVPLSLLLVLIGPWVLPLFGEGFEGAQSTLSLLVVGRLVTCLAGTVGFLLAMTGHQGRVAKLMTLSAAIKIALNLLWIPSFGETGAALATVVMLSLFALLAWRDVRRLLGIEPTILASFGWLPAAPVAAAADAASDEEPGR